MSGQPGFPIGISPSQYAAMTANFVCQVSTFNTEYNVKLPLTWFSQFFRSHEVHLQAQVKGGVFVFPAINHVRVW